MTNKSATRQCSAQTSSRSAFVHEGKTVVGRRIRGLRSGPAELAGKCRRVRTHTSGGRSFDPAGERFPFEIAASDRVISPANGQALNSRCHELGDLHLRGAADVADLSRCTRVSRARIVSSRGSRIKAWIWYRSWVICKRRRPAYTVQMGPEKPDVIPPRPTRLWFARERRRWRCTSSPKLTPKLSADTCRR
jgi:hypothetical protein